MKIKPWIFAFTIWLSFLGAAIAVASPASRLLEAIESERPMFIATWKSTVNIDSGTGDTRGLAEMEAFIVQRLNRLGAEVQTVPVQPGVGKNIIGTFKGTGNRRIMLMIHYDTVFKAGDAAGRPFKIMGERAFGPGVADAKGGVALILHAIKLLQGLNFSDYGRLTVFFNPDEEESSMGSRKTIQELAVGQDYVLSYEPPDRDIVTVATNGIARLHLTVKGRASHAGSAPEQGRNAGIELAHQLLQLNGLGDPAKGTTVNWTVARVGEKPNMIPAEAHAIADMRLSQISELERVRRQAEKIIQRRLVPGAHVTVEVENRRPPLSWNRASEKLASKAKHIGKEIGYRIESAKMRFGTDAAFAYNPERKKPAVLETMGIVGKHIHSPEEFAKVDRIVPRLYLTVRMVQALSETRQAGY